MSSAAQRVFAIPELLEHNLLFTNENSLHVADETHSKELFRLQRVNHSFNSIINGSMRLKCKMGVASPVPADNGLVRLHGLVSPYLMKKELQCSGFDCGEVKIHLDVKCDLTTLGDDTSDTLYNGVGDFVAVQYTTTEQNLDSVTKADAGLVNIDNKRHSARHHSWRQVKASNSKVTFWVEVHVSFQNPYEQGNEPSGWSRYREILMDTNGQLTLGDIADMLDTVSQRTLFEHAALEHYVHHRYEIERDAVYVPFATHEMTKRFLQAACMHVTWMSFEYEPATRSLKKTMALRPDFWATSATNDLDQKLRGSRKIELRKPYAETECEAMKNQETSGDPSPTQSLDVVDVALCVVIAIEICAAGLILGFFLWMLGRWAWSLE